MDNNYQQEIDKGLRFGFGRNWKDFLSTLDNEVIVKAAQDIKDWTGHQSFAGMRVIDIGSGSGIHSFAFHSLGADELLSFDYDNDSVEATKQMWEKAGRPQNWNVTQGSVLDASFLNSLGTFDMVYSWGVLHHTGSMWEAIGNAASVLSHDGLMWIAIYQKGSSYASDLALKQRYNRNSAFGKKIMEWKWILRLMAKRLFNGKNPFTWNEKVERGMNVHNDIIDWLGGLPYEVADKTEIEAFGKTKGLILVKTKELPEGGCSSYLFRKSTPI